MLLIMFPKIEIWLSFAIILFKDHFPCHLVISLHNNEIYGPKTGLLDSSYANMQYEFKPWRSRVRLKYIFFGYDIYISYEQNYVYQIFYQTLQTH